MVVAPQHAHPVQIPCLGYGMLGNAVVAPVGSGTRTEDVVAHMVPTVQGAIHALSFPHDVVLVVADVLE